MGAHADVTATGQATRLSWSNQRLELQAAMYTQAETVQNYTDKRAQVRGLCSAPNTALPFVSGRVRPSVKYYTTKKQALSSTNFHNRMTMST